MIILYNIVLFIIQQLIVRLIILMEEKKSLESAMLEINMIKIAKIILWIQTILIITIKL